MFACAFSHVLIAIRVKWPDAVVLAIMDDLYVNCHPDHVEEIFADLEALCAEIELVLHPGKSELWMPDGPLAQYFVRVTEYPECVTAPVINFYN